MFEADAWRIWWWGRVVILANCCLHVFCLHLKYRIHRCIYEVFHEVYPSQQGAQQFCLPFLSTFLSSGSPFLLYFFFWFPFLRVTWWRSIFTATSPRQLFHAQTWPHSHWSMGRLLDKGTGALGFGFLSQKLNCFKHLLFWPYNLNYESSCYFCSTLHSKCVLISAFHKPAESAFFGPCLCLRIGSFTSWLRKLSS